MNAAVATKSLPESTTRSQQPAGSAFTKRLETKLGHVLEAVEQSEPYRALMAPESSPRQIATILKYVLLEVFSYGPHVTEATFLAISRLPKNRPDLMKPMILHDLEEVDHGEMALRDFVKLGGDESWARERRITPESFAMGATCRRLAAQESPFAYLGYMYLFEALTPILTARVQAVLTVKSFPTAARHFIDFHAAEDIAHAKAMLSLIERVTRDYPEAAAAIEYGFDCFATVYPLPIWRAALRHARTELEGGAK